VVAATGTGMQLAARWPMRWLLATRAGWSGTILRVVLAVVMFPHGAQKVLGWFGGPGFSAQMHAFTQDMGLPWIVGLLVMVAELLGSLALLVGFLTRLAALGIGCVMVGAIALVHAHNGFFMNWYGQKAGEGYEYHLLALAIVLALIVGGAGRLSLDRRLTRAR